MSTNGTNRPTNLGSLRPSQIMFTYGIGAIVDLPYLSTIVMGIDDWGVDPAVSPPITEERLLRAVQHMVGSQVRELKLPPTERDSGGLPNPFSSQALTGMPVATFPRWMLCPRCQRLAALSSGLFHLKPMPYRPEYTRYVHVNCQDANQPPVVPARFLVACSEGHLDDFPWIDFAHHGAPCDQPLLRLIEYGPSGEARELEVRCDTCNKRRRMSEAFGDSGKQTMPQCRGRRPHLRDFEEDGCSQQVRAMLLGTSNLWFPEVLTTMTIPMASTHIDQLVEEQWSKLKAATSPDILEAFRSIGQLGDFSGYSISEIWEAVQRRHNHGEQENETDPTDLKTPEWQVFSQPSSYGGGADLELRQVDVPSGLENCLDKVVIVDRLREVRALIGFTRIDAPPDFDEEPTGGGSTRAPISRQPPPWLPAADVRGEGVFIQFREGSIQRWLERDDVYSLRRQFFNSHRSWRQLRRLDPVEDGFPGMRYVLLHSFSHALMRRLALECGYNAASIRERIYSRNPNEYENRPEPMAGILIYTAAADSEGTLGGLAALGEPDELGRHIAGALRDAEMCASDPLCAEHEPSVRGLTLHGAACHACLFAPETSCERGNRYLDRSVLSRTIETDDRAFFPMAK